MGITVLSTNPVFTLTLPSPLKGEGKRKTHTIS
jgi:hypothetical protein